MLELLHATLFSSSDKGIFRADLISQLLDSRKLAQCKFNLYSHRREDINWTVTQMSPLNLDSFVSCWNSLGLGSHEQRGSFPLCWASENVRQAYMFEKDKEGTKMANVKVTSLLTLSPNMIWEENEHGILRDCEQILMGTWGGKAAGPYGKGGETANFHFYTRLFLTPKQGIGYSEISMI